MREEALEYRQKAEEEVLMDKFQKNDLSVSTYNSKIKKLEKWVDKEKLQINKYKKDIKKGVCSTTEAIKRT